MRGVLGSGQACIRRVTAPRHRTDTDPNRLFWLFLLQELVGYVWKGNLKNHITFMLNPKHGIHITFSKTQKTLWRRGQKDWIPCYCMWHGHCNHGQIQQGQPAQNTHGTKTRKKGGYRLWRRTAGMVEEKGQWGRTRIHTWYTYANSPKI